MTQELRELLRDEERTSNALIGGIAAVMAALFVAAAAAILLGN